MKTLKLKSFAVILTALAIALLGCEEINDDEFINEKSAPDSTYFDSTYNALSDGFALVTISGTGSNADGEIFGYTNTGSDFTLRAQAPVSISGGITGNSFIIPMTNGGSWKISRSGNGAFLSHIYWISCDGLGSWSDDLGGNLDLDLRGYGVEHCFGSAESDGFVLATVSGMGTTYSGGAFGSTADPGSTNHTLRQTVSVNSSSNITNNSFMMPVRKGDDWAVTYAGDAIFKGHIYWIPFNKCVKGFGSWSNDLSDSLNLDLRGYGVEHYIHDAAESDGFVLATIYVTGSSGHGGMFGCTENLLRADASVDSYDGGGIGNNSFMMPVSEGETWSVTYAGDGWFKGHIYWISCKGLGSWSDDLSDDRRKRGKE